MPWQILPVIFGLKTAILIPLPLQLLNLLKSLEISKPRRVYMKDKTFIQGLY
jgi:hypothetical protein